MRALSPSTGGPPSPVLPDVRGALPDLAARLRRGPHPIFLAPAIVVAWTAFATIAYYGPIPWLDQWSFLAEYQHLLDHGLTLGWLFASHNGHRIATSRPFFLADLEWFGGRNTFLIDCIWATQTCGAVLFIRLAEAGERNGLKALGLALAIMLLFSLMQVQNFLQGFQLSYVGVFALAAWCAAVLLGGERLTSIRLSGGLALLVLATATLANGFLIGVAIAIVCALTRSRRAAAAAVLGVTLVLGIAYALTLDTPRPSLTQMLAPNWWVYMAAYIGNVWAYEPAQAEFVPAAVAGGLGLVLLAAAAIRVARRPAPTPATLLAIMMFVALTAMLTALGRLYLGVDEALDSRFATPSAYFWAAMAIFWTREITEINDAKMSRIAAIVTCFGLVLSAELEYAGYKQAINFSETTKSAERLLAAHRDAAAVELLSNGDTQFFRQISASYPRSLAILRSRRLSIFSRS